MVKIQEAENQIMIDYEVYDKRPSDSALLIPAIEAHEEQWDASRVWWRRTPASTPPATKSAQKRESSAFAFPIATKSAERKREQKKRWFRKDRNGGPAAKGASAC